MLTRSKGRSQSSPFILLALASVSLLSLARPALAQSPSPLAGDAPQREGYPSNVIVSERSRSFVGGRPFPAVNGLAIQRPGRPTVDRALGIALMPGLEIVPSRTVELFNRPAVFRTDRMQAAPPAAPGKAITLHPLAYRGIPLAPGSDVLSVATTTGRLLHVRERNVPRAVDGTNPTVERDAARRVALEAGRSHAMPQDADAGEPNLEVFVDRPANGRLAWRVRVASPSLTAPWAREIWVAAIGTPVVLADREAIFHTHNGHVTAAMFEASPLAGSGTQDLSDAFVNRTNGGGGRVTTGADGLYAFATGTGNATLSVGLRGPHSAVDNVAGAEMTTVANGSPASPVDLFLNATTALELAQTSAFAWVNRGRGLAEGFLSPGALSELSTRVNIADQCNAFWNGQSLNFFQAGGGCVNTAYADVVLHEFGHAIDDSIGGIIDGGYSEGFGDALGLIGTRQPCLGRDFFGAGTCLRPATDIITWPPNTDEVHAVGRRYAGFAWELITQLKSVYTQDTAFDIAKQLILGAGAANPSDIPDAVRLSFIVDDDDGNLATCSLHFHMLAAAADSRNIPRPPDCISSAGHVRLQGDLNKDGIADIVAFGDAGVWTALGTGDGGFAPERFVLANFGANQGWNPADHVRLLGDLNNDGNVDIVGFGHAGVWTALGTGDGGFAPEHFVLANFGFDHAWRSTKHVRLLADLNKDGRADIVGFGDAGVWTALGTGDGGFSPERFVVANFGFDQAWRSTKHVRLLDDLNKDGIADIVAFGDAGVWTALGTGDGGFASERFVLANFGANQGWNPAQDVRLTGDLNNDGNADLVAFGDAGVWTALGTGDGGFAPEHFVLANFGTNQGWNPAEHERLLGDLNQDGKVDIVAFGTAGVWTALASGDGGFAPEHFVLANFGFDHGWHSSKHVRLLSNLNRDRGVDITAFGDAGVWTSLGTGDGGFASEHFVLANFGFDQGWRVDLPLAE